MAAKTFLSSTKEADVERSAEDIRRDIAQGKENISRTVEKIDERIKEKLDWHEYVKRSPYWSLGAAAGLGYLASKIFRTRTTSLERIMGSFAEELHDSLGGQRAGTSGPGLIKLTLVAIATKAVVGWINNEASTPVKSHGARPRPRTKHEPRKKPESADNKANKMKS